MATNKWLADLQILKSNTNALRRNLRDGNVYASDNDTLQTLVGKVPALAPIEDSDTWQPDPLWKFPDPNGTETLKTIREIYDEDTMASSYTYRGIYQILGELDTIDLKAAISNKRTYADTFILSDGTTYENITAKTLEHTWDKSKDVVDSVGRTIRYVRVYSNTAYNYIPGFYNSLLWAVHNLTQSPYNITSTSAGYAPYICTYSPCECVELMNNATSITFNYPRNLKKLVIDGANINGSVDLFMPMLKEFEVKSTPQFSLSSSTSSNNPSKLHIKKLLVPNNFSGNITITFTNVLYSQSIDELDFSKTLSSSISISYLHTNKILYPQTVTYISLTNIYCLENLDIPTNVNTLRLSIIENLKYLTVPESVTTINLQNLYSLRELTIPYNFNLTGINLSKSYYMEHDSLVSILENLADLTDQTAKTITFGSANLSKLTDEEKAIATNKNWTLS